MRCPNCNNEMSNNERICHYCGYNFDNNYAMVNNVANKYGKVIHRGRRIIVGVIMLLIGLFGLFVSLGGIIYNKTVARDYVEIEANYVRYEGEGQLYTGVYEYEVDGKKYEKNCGQAYDRVEEIPQHCMIKYNKDNPEKATDSTDISLTTVLIDLVFVVIAVIVIFYKPKNQQEQYINYGPYTN